MWASLLSSHRHVRLVFKLVGSAPLLGFRWYLLEWIRQQNFHISVFCRYFCCCFVFVCFLVHFTSQSYPPPFSPPGPTFLHSYPYLSSPTAQKRGTHHHHQPIPAHQVQLHTTLKCGYVERRYRKPDWITKYRTTTKQLFCSGYDSCKVRPLVLMIRRYLRGKPHMQEKTWILSNTSVWMNYAVFPIDTFSSPIPLSKNQMSFFCKLFDTIRLSSLPLLLIKIKS